MKKKNIFLALLLLGGFSTQAQVSISDDFEGNGNIQWVADAIELDNNFSNPFSTDINTSNTVLRYHDEGGQYANVRFDVDGIFNVEENSAFSFKIYVPSNGITGNQNNQVSLKLQSNFNPPAWSTQSEIIKPIVLDQWQTVSFNFTSDNYINLDDDALPPTERTDFDRIVIQVNGEDNEDEVIAYLDDFVYEGTIVDAPEDPNDVGEAIYDPTTEYVFDNLVWSDEFDTDGAISNVKWFHQTIIPNGEGWFNNEQQLYTDNLKNSYVEDGVMYLTAINEEVTLQGVTKNYSSARLNSKFAFTYGRVEVRAKIPTGQGTWPAIWTLGQNLNENGSYWQQMGYGETGWPACGEIDIMEHWGNNQNYVQSAMHTPSSYGATENHDGQYIPTTSTAFHTYALEWTPNKMVFSVDDVVHYVYDPADKNEDTWPFDAPQYILLNFAIQENISPTFTQDDMEVDYVRVYEASTVEVETTSDILDKSKVMKFYPNPVNDKLTVLVEAQSADSIDFNIATIKGKLVQSGKATINNEKIVLNDLDNLARGIYLISFQIENDNYTIKFLKN